MILETKKTDIKTNISDKKSFTIETNAAAFEILSKNLYQNIPRAIIRELCTNAIDANKQLNQPLNNFEVTLPNYSGSNTFSIEDFGVGMSYDDVINTYTSFFSSTKNDSNEQTGMFGLGSKTPFAYTAQFTIDTTKAGEKCIFNAFKDENGMPCVSLITRIPVDKNLHGTKISFSVKSSDITSFYKEFIYCVKTFPDIPKIKENDSFLSYIRMDFPLSRGNEILELVKLNKLYKKNYFLFSETNSVHNSYDVQLFLEMGSVLYNVDLDSHLKDDTVDRLIDNIVRSISHDGVTILHANIGDVSITPSREELQYDSKTLNFIRKKIFEIFFIDIFKYKTLEDYWKQHVTMNKTIFYDIAFDSEKYLLCKKYFTQDVVLSIEETKTFIAEKEALIHEIADYLPIKTFFEIKSIAKNNLLNTTKCPSLIASCINDVVDARHLPSIKVNCLNSFFYEAYKYNKSSNHIFIVNLNEKFAKYSNVSSRIQQSSAITWRHMSFIRQYCIDNNISEPNLVSILYIANDADATQKVASAFNVKILPFDEWCNIDNAFAKKTKVVSSNIDNTIVDVFFSSTTFYEHVSGKKFIPDNGWQKTYSEIKQLAKAEKAKIFLLPKYKGACVMPKNVAKFMAAPKKYKDGFEFSINVADYLKNVSSFSTYKPLKDAIENEKCFFVYMKYTMIDDDVINETNGVDWISYFAPILFKHTNKLIADYKKSNVNTNVEMLPLFFKSCGIDQLLEQKSNKVNQKNCLAYSLISSQDDKRTITSIDISLRDTLYIFNSVINLFSDLKNMLPKNNIKDYNDLMQCRQTFTRVQYTQDGPNTDLLLKHYPMLQYVKSLYCGEINRETDDKKVVEYILHEDKLI